MTRWVSNCAFPPKNSVQGYTRRRIQEAPNYPLSLCINGTIKFSNISENDAVVDFAITVQTWGKLGKKLNFMAGTQQFVIIQVVFKRKAIFFLS